MDFRLQKMTKRYLWNKLNQKSLPVGSSVYLEIQAAKLQMESTLATLKKWKTRAVLKWSEYIYKYKYQFLFTKNSSKVKFEDAMNRSRHVHSIGLIPFLSIAFIVSSYQYKL